MGTVKDVIFIWIFSHREFLLSKKCVKVKKTTTNISGVLEFITVELLLDA